MNDLVKQASKPKLLKKLHTKLYGKKPSVSKLESLGISLLGGAGGAAIGGRIGARIGKKSDEAFTAAAKADHAKKVKAYNDELAKLEKDHPVKKSLFGFGKPKKLPENSVFSDDIAGGMATMAALPLLLPAMVAGVPIPVRSTRRFVRKGLDKNYRMPKDPGAFKHPKSNVGLFGGSYIKEFEQLGKLKGGLKGLAAGTLTGSAAKQLLLKSRKAKSLKRRRKVNFALGATGLGAALAASKKKSKKKA